MIRCLVYLLIRSHTHFQKAECVFLPMTESGLVNISQSID